MVCRWAGSQMQQREAQRFDKQTPLPPSKYLSILAMYLERSHDHWNHPGILVRTENITARISMKEGLIVVGAK